MLVNVSVIVPVGVQVKLLPAVMSKLPSLSVTKVPLAAPEKVDPPEITCAPEKVFVPLELILPEMILEPDRVFVEDIIAPPEAVRIPVTVMVLDVNPPEATNPPATVRGSPDEPVWNSFK
jgi:hypothetical protein